MSILSSTLSGKAKVDAEYIKYGLDPKLVCNNLNGTIDYYGNVYMCSMALSHIPFKFNIVRGNFNCAHNSLTTLEGAPWRVDGFFRCSCNELCTLDGCPLYTGGFDCNNNKLVSLKHGPIKVNGSYIISHNIITSLEGMPYEVHGHLDCTYNRLTTLKGSPLRVNGSMSVGKNLLDDLIGAPAYIEGSFDIGYLFIKSIDGLPKCIGGTLFARDTYLTDIRETGNSDTPNFHMEPLTKEQIIEYVEKHQCVLGYWRNEQSMPEPKIVAYGRLH